MRNDVWLKMEPTIFTTEYLKERNKINKNEIVACVCVNS